MLDCSRLRFLVIEDSPTMRTWLRNAIIGMGGKVVDQATGYSDALYRIANREPFDVVICDYVLSEEKHNTTSGGQKVVSRDGQHLLEECRLRRLIPSCCVFIMVTGESAYERVFAVAELAPDDYLLKPLTPGVLAERLTKAYERSQTLKPLTALLDKERFVDCLTACRQFLKEKKRYRLDVLRLVGDCLLKLNRFEEAHRHFENVLVDTPGLPWARIGAARSFFALDRYDESRALLESLITEQADFIEAHDLLAQVHEVKGTPERSRALLKEILAKNPRAVRRHREVVRMALDIGDIEDAREAYEQMFLHGTGSAAVSPNDFSGFSTLLLNDPTPKAKERLSKLISVLNDQYVKSDTQQAGDYKLAELVAQFTRAKLDGKADESQRYYQQISSMQRERPISDNMMRLSLMQVAASAGDDYAAAAIARSVMADYHGNESMQSRIIRELEASGLADLAKQIGAESDQAMLEMNKEAVRHAKLGAMREAMDEFIRLADTTRNLSVTFNAGLSIIRWMEKNPRDEALVSKLKHYLEVISNRDPENPRTKQLIEMSAAVIR